ncbi:hypothetical protein HID58_095423, partial [Brassica napus]
GKFNWAGAAYDCEQIALPPLLMTKVPALGHFANDRKEINESVPSVNRTFLTLLTDLLASRKVYGYLPEALAQKHSSFRDNTDLIMVISLQPWLPFIPDDVIFLSLASSLLYLPLKLQFVGDSLKILRQEVEEHSARLGQSRLISLKNNLDIHSDKEFVPHCTKFEHVAHCIQIFGLWGGQLTPEMQESWSKPYIKESCYKEKMFRQACCFLHKWKRWRSSADVIGLDWTKIWLMEGADCDCRVRNVDPANLLSLLPALTEETHRLVVYFVELKKLKENVFYVLISVLPCHYHICPKRKWAFRLVGQPASEFLLNQRRVHLVQTIPSWREHSLRDEGWGGAVAKTKTRRMEATAGPDCALPEEVCLWMDAKAMGSDIILAGGSKHGTFIHYVSSSSGLLTVQIKALRASLMSSNTRNCIEAGGIPEC